MMCSPLIGNADVLRLYAADYMPDTLEAMTLKSNLNEFDKLLQNITSRILDLETQLHDLYAQRHDLLNASVVKKALIAPIRKLPPETLGYVFQLACDGEVVAGNEPRMITPSAMQFQVSQVCSKWRRVALGTPHLWTSIALDNSPASPNVNPFIVMTEWVRRSGGLPIDVYLGDGLERIFLSPKYGTSLRVSMKMLSRHFDRCRSFHITRPFWQVLPALFPVGQRKMASSLREFGVLLATPSAHALPFGLIDAPLLEKIDVVRPYTIFDSLAIDYSRIRSLRWNTPPRFDHSPISTHRLAEVLEKCTNLSSCEIIYPIHTITNPLPSKDFINVPSLTHLTLKFSLQSDPSALLSILRTPSLHTLVLEQTGPIANIPGFSGAVTSFLANSTAPLKELHLTRLILTAADTPLISALSRVESIHVKQSFIHDEFLEALKPQRDVHPDAWPAPMLGTLSFEASMFGAEALRQMVEARLGKPGVGEGEQMEIDIDPEYRPKLVALSLIRCRFGGEDPNTVSRIQGIVVDIVSDDL